MPQKQKITKTEVKKIIHAVGYLSAEDKKKWLSIVNVSADDQLSQIYDHFFDMSQKEDKHTKIVLIKANKHKKYAANMKNIASKFKKEALIKEEAASKQKQENLADILEKLNE